jgi:anti-sigma regulatory factor (Ser/Thr protein kinase)
LPRSRTRYWKVAWSSGRPRRKGASHAPVCRSRFSYRHSDHAGRSSARACAAAVPRSGATRACGPETQLELGPFDTAPGCARGLLREFLGRWGLAHLSDPGDEIITELVTNAIAASISKALEGTEPRPVTLWLTLRDGELCIRVRDADPTPPPRDQPLPGDDAESGRGLFLVGAFSKRWGYYPGPQGGKFTWATLDATSRAAGGTA